MAEKGRSYEVKGERFQLPPPSLVKTLTNVSGTVDTWPAHATGRYSSANMITMTKDKRLLVVNEEIRGRPTMVPKPRFLEQLEGYLQRELAAHNVQQVAASPVRLQIHREVFEYLIEAFKAYKPLMSAIKREYEMMLAELREQVRNMEPMKEMLWTLSQECDRRVIHLREEEKQEIIDLKHQNKQLNFKISAMAQEHNDLLCQVERLQNELAFEHQRYRDELDSRKLLVSDINELRTAQEELIMQKKKKAEMEQEEEDPVRLKIALFEAKRAQSDAVDALNKMEADYSDVIPRRDYENLHKEQERMVEIQNSMVTQLKGTREEFENLRLVHEDVVQQRDQYFMELESLRRNATPRPDWYRCAEYIYGGLPRWQEMAAGKSSEEMLQVLLQEMTGGDADTSGMQGKGLEDTVPKFLRHEGSVQNRRMTKRDCRIHIREMWDERKGMKDEEAAAKANGQEFDLTPFGEFLDNFFHKVYGIDQIRIEWAYSFYDALSRFNTDDKVDQFRGIVDNEVDEDVYWEEMRIMGNLLDHFKSLDAEAKGSLTPEEFRQALTSFYPAKDEEWIAQLVTTAETELAVSEEEPVFEYERLFMSDDEGEFGPFLKEVRRVLYEDKTKYVDEIRKELIDLGKEKVDIEEVRKAIAIVDPQIEQYQLDDYLCWAFRCPKEELEDRHALEVASVIDRLGKGNVKRIGART